MDPAVDETLAREANSAAATERRIVAILFADLVGFTSLSERLDAEDIASIQDAYFAEVRTAIERYGGVLEKFIGDAAMAAFGLPKARDDDAVRSVRAGLALVSAVARLDAALGLEQGTLAVRVGVNAGEVVHTVTGADGGRVTGDAVNVAARLQAAAAPGAVLVGEETALAVDDAIELAETIALEVKGKAEPVRARVATGVRAVPSREAALGRLRTTTVGRRDELALLDDAFSDAVESASARLLVVVAPPGVGKSRLLREWSDGVASAGRGTVWWARVRPEVLAPDAVVAQLVAAAQPGRPPDVAGITARLTGAGLSAARADVVARELVATASPGATPPMESDRDRRIEAWVEGLDALAETPVAWLIEDAHWAGADLLALVAAARDTASLRGRLVVMTARPSILERPGLGADGGNVDAADCLMLSGLGAGDAASLVRGLVGDALPPDLIDEIAQRSDGTPLFIEELLRTWVAVGVLAADGDGWRLTRPPDALRLPQSVHAIYAAQLDDLPTTARSLAVRASVAGRRFPVAALPTLDVDEAEAGLGVLTARALVSGPSDESGVGPAYAYRHALLRDAAYAGLARVERAALHVRLARWLADAAGVRRSEVAELVGGHYEQALASVPALTREVAPGLDRVAIARLAAAWLEEAAETTLRGGAHGAAKSLAERAVAATPPDDDIDAARRLALLGRILVEGDDMRAGTEHLVEAADRLRARLVDGDDAQRATVRELYAATVARLCAARYQQIRFAEGVELADAALANVGPRDDAATARLRIARILSHLGATNEARDAVPLLEAALRVARDASDVQLEYDALDALARVRSETGDTRPEDWLAVAEAARNVGDWDGHVRAGLNAATHLVDESPSRLPAVVAPLADVAEARGLRETRAWIAQATAETCFLTGAWREALAHADTALDLAERYGYDRAAVRTWFVVVPIAAVRSDVARLGRAAEWFAARRGELPPSPYGAIMQSSVDVWLAAAGLLDPPALPLARLLPGFELAYDDATFLAASEHVLLELQARGDGDGARAALDRLQTTAPPLPRNWLGTGSGLLLRAAVAANGREAARIDAAEARTYFSRLGAAWWTARAIRRLAELGSARPADLEEAEGIEARLLA